MRIGSHGVTQTRYKSPGSWGAVQVIVANIGEKGGIT